MNEFFRRIHYLLNRRRMDAELANDMDVHREMSGAAPFGNTLRLREESRDAWGWTWIDRFLQDLRYAIRILRKSPGFALAAILMLAIGIGVNVAVFGFFDLMVLRPLNVRDPATLLRFHRRSPQRFAFALPYPELAFFRDNTKTLSSVIAINITKVAIEGDDKQQIAHFVSANFFRELGAPIAFGRMLERRDEAPGAPPVVVLSHRFWERHFASDPLIVGNTIRVNAKLATVIGVVAREFSGLSLDDTAFWSPLERQPYFASGSHLLTDLSEDTSGVEMWGRLQPGLTPVTAESELTSLAAELRHQHPDAIWDHEGIPSESGAYATSIMIGNRRGSGSEGNNELYPIAALAATLGLLILGVACGNLGSLLLARGVARQREISIRISVGAGSGRLIRQLFTESLLLALAGSAAGLLLGYVVLQGLMTLTEAPAWLNPIPDWRVIAFAAGTGIFAAFLFGLTPAFQIARQRHRVTITQQLLVASQVAASCILLIVAGLLGRALNHAMSTDPGFAYQQVISIDPALARHGYSPDRARQYLDTLQSRLGALPGVKSVSLTLVPPLGNVSIGAGIDIDAQHVNMQINHVDPQFFSTMKIPLLRGRNLAPGDRQAIVISESMARHAWPGQDPLGHKLTMERDYTVVGICGNARSIKLEDSNSVEVYFPIGTPDLPSLFVLVEAAGAPEGIARSVATTAKAVDLNTFPEIQLMKSGFQRKLRGAEYSALAVGVLGSVAQLLACLGIVGVVAYAVSRRTKEIGIRMALGARPAQVITVVLRQFTIPVGAGLLLGVGAAAALSQLLRGVLYGVSNLDPAAYLGAILLFAGTVALAALLPARRALRVDPMVSLRQE